MFPPSFKLIAHIVIHVQNYLFYSGYANYCMINFTHLEEFISETERFDKPNEQSQACLSYAMAKNALFEEREKNVLISQMSRAKLAPNCSGATSLQGYDQHIFSLRNEKIPFRFIMASFLKSNLG